MSPSPSGAERVLVTGGAGYIGSIASHILLAQGFEVSVIDDCSTGHADAVPTSARFIEGSLLDRKAISEALTGCTSVIHFAGKSLVGESVARPDLYKRVNVGGSQNLLEEMYAARVDRLVFSSSASTYGEPETLPITENARTHPTNPYGDTKLAIETLISQASKSQGMATASLRYFNVAGALETQHGWLSERHDPETHLIPNVLKSTTTEPVKIFGTAWSTPDGTCIRDYVHVVDLVEAHISALRALQVSQHKIFNLGSSCGYSVREVLHTAEKVLGHSVARIEVSARAGDPEILIADISKAKSELQWSPTRDLRRMIEDCAKSMGAI